ncbi:MAG: LUD domain-containing protein [Gemmatimonadales bacterium]
MGPSNRATVLSARSDILDAIRRAAVPAAPPAAMVRREPDAGPLLDRFLQALDQVGGHGVQRRPHQSLHDVASMLVGDGQSGTVVRGRFAVAENGAVYVDAADLADPIDILVAEHLLIVVPAGAIVATMHEAVRLIPPQSRCGWFQSGPSKTADIEQSLVVGAQGARTLHVILTW